ncbi:MAG: hypothetical protein M1821_004544 [Bathelium mastoideum]|nr:MAG: hypothetical protein M1821_004544 [Bathelium mastoideum]
MASSASSSERYLTTSEGAITPAKVIAVGAVLPSLAIIAVVLRFQVRLKTRVDSLDLKNEEMSKALTEENQILTIGMGAMMIVGSALGGLARPTPQGTTPKGYLTAYDEANKITDKIFWTFDLVQCWAFGTAKLSVIFFYRRIFTGKVFNVISISMVAIVCVWTLGFFFAILFRCGTHFWALWAPLIYLLQNCYLSTPMFQAFTISDVITDVLILTIPVYWVSKLKMPLTQRVGVCGVFLLGAVTVAAGVARLVIFIQQTKNPYLNADGIGHLTTEIYWSMIEMGISVVAACLPTMKPLFGKLSPENVLNSFRSMFPLRSRTSLTSSRSREANGTEQILHRANYENIDSLENGILSGRGPEKTNETWVMTDFEVPKPWQQTNTPDEGIRVQRRIEQRTEDRRY